MTTHTRDARLDALQRLVDHLRANPAIPVPALEHSVNIVGDDVLPAIQQLAPCTIKAAGQGASEAAKYQIVSRDFGAGIVLNMWVAGSAVGEPVTSTTTVEVTEYVLRPEVVAALAGERVSA